VSYYTSTSTQSDNNWLEAIQHTLIDHPYYGIYRLYLHFKNEGITVSQSKLRRICRANNIHVPQKTKHPPKRDKGNEESEIPNLLKSLTLKNLDNTHQPTAMTTPDYVWCGDFSYFNWYGQWYYLATVIDVCTKEIMGFSLSSNHNTLLIIQALKSSLQKGRKPIIFHSDQGSEYTSSQYQQLLARNLILPSNSAKSSPWENSYQESFYGKFKQELQLYELPRTSTFIDIYNKMAEQVHYYNTKRIHTTIKTIPKLFYEQIKGKPEVQPQPVKLTMKEENYVS
jgi:putative transposase